jgi:hypothetical protein
MAQNTKEVKLAKTLTGLFVLLVGLMIFREARDMLRERPAHTHVERLAAYRPRRAPVGEIEHEQSGYAERLKTSQVAEVAAARSA